MIRPAKFVDTPRIVELLCEMHSRSRYLTIDEVDEAAAHKLISHGVQRHGFTHEGGTICMVSETAGRIEGFLMGMLDRVYHIGKKLCANDIYLYCTDQAHRMDMPRLFDAYMSWAMGNPKVVSIKGSWTDALPGAERIGGLYERKGFRRSGEIWERVINNEQPCPTRLELLAEGFVE